MSRYLITGGCGSIGSEIARQLVARGDSVMVLDNLSGGSLDNITDVADSVHVTIDDVQHVSRLRALVEQADFVLHLAASLGVRNVIENPVPTMFNNLESTRLALEVASEFRRPVLVASTSEVYGLSDRLPFREDDPVTLGASSVMRWQYATCKFADEFMALAYMQERGLPVVVTRFFNAVGPAQNDKYGFVVGRFVRQALANEPITIFGDGNQSRCFCDCRDTALASIKLMDAKAWGEVVNIGTTNEVTIGDLARLVKERTGSKSPIQYVSYSQAYGTGYQDMSRRVPDVSKLKRLTGFVPNAHLFETIDRMAEHLRNEVVAVEVM